MRAGKVTGAEICINELLPTALPRTFILVIYTRVGLAGLEDVADAGAGNAMPNGRLQSRALPPSYATGVPEPCAPPDSLIEPQILMGGESVGRDEEPTLGWEP